MWDPLGLNPYDAFRMNDFDHTLGGGGGRGGGGGGGRGRGSGAKCSGSKVPFTTSGGRMHRFNDKISTQNLKGVRFPKGKKLLESLGLRHRVNPRTGRHEFADSSGRVRVAYDKASSQSAPYKKQGHWHKYGHARGQTYKLDNSGRTTDPRGTAAHIPCK